MGAIEEYTVSVEIQKVKDKLKFHFTADCGKHGTDESLAEYTFDDVRLLQIFASVEVTEEELS